MSSAVRLSFVSLSLCALIGHASVTDVKHVAAVCHFGLKGKAAAQSVDGDPSHPPTVGSTLVSCQRAGAGILTKVGSSRRD